MATFIKRWAQAGCKAIRSARRKKKMSAKTQLISEEIHKLQRFITKIMLDGDLHIGDYREIDINLHTIEALVDFADFDKHEY
jgi:hypothetical protein